MTTFNQEDLIRYLYGETSEKKADLIREALKKDWKLRQSYEQLASMQQPLDELKTTPSDKVIERILEYAAKKQNKNIQAH